MLVTSVGGLVGAALLLLVGEPMYAALDLTPFATVAAALLSGGVVHAIGQYRKAPAEVESISVATLSAALEQMRQEIARKDQTIAECQNRIRQLEGSNA